MTLSVTPGPHPGLLRKPGAQPSNLGLLHYEYVIKIIVASSPKFHILVSTSSFPELCSYFSTGYLYSIRLCHHLDLLKDLDPALLDGSLQIQCPSAILCKKKKKSRLAPGLTLQTSTVPLPRRSPKCGMGP